MITVKTFTATIYVGLHNRDTDETFSLHDAREVCRDYCDQTGFCVTLTETEFIYTNGEEAGVIVGIINYPRFNDCDQNLKARALDLAERFRKEFGQYRVSVVFPDETVMLGD